MKKLTPNGVSRLACGHEAIQEKIIVEVSNLKFKSEEIQCF